MNKDLLTFIELCLIDGAISEKERKVIFAKAKELGVGKDECDVLIESLTQKKNKTIGNSGIICRGGPGKKLIRDSPAGAFIKYHKFASNPGSPPTKRLMI